MGLFGPPKIEKLKTERDIRGLQKALRHKDWEINRKAAVALCEFKQPDGFTFLKEHLKNADPVAALQSAIHLAEFEDRSGLQVLIESLKEKPNVLIIKLLGKLKDPAAFALNDVFFPVRSTTLKAQVVPSGFSRNAT